MTNDVLPSVYLVRHGETAWSLTGQHTGRCNIPLTEKGEQDARKLAGRLSGAQYTKVFVSPLQRAAKTCELAGYSGVAEIDPDLVEWDYGDYEGRRSVEIHAEHPDWNLFRDGCPNGESPADVGRRADAIVERVRKFEGQVLLFSSGHLLRVLASRWLDLEPSAARCFWLDTGSVSQLGYERDRSKPVIRLWNDTHHLRLS